MKFSWRPCENLIQLRCLILTAGMAPFQESVKRAFNFVPKIGSWKVYYGIVMTEGWIRVLGLAWIVPHWHVRKRAFAFVSRWWIECLHVWVTWWYLFEGHKRTSSFWNAILFKSWSPREELRDQLARRSMLSRVGYEKRQFWRRRKIIWLLNTNVPIR